MIKTVANNYTALRTAYDGKWLYELKRVHDLPFPNIAKYRVFKGNCNMMLAVGGPFGDGVYAVVEMGGKWDFCYMGVLEAGHTVRMMTKRNFIKYHA